MSLHIDQPLGWVLRAGCADLLLSDFFVDPSATIKPETLMVCRSCPVRRQCLEHAYERGLERGYFGGLSPVQRKSMTKECAMRAIDAESCH